jgi:CheY-like chemotaxis protein
MSININELRFEILEEIAENLVDFGNIIFELSRNGDYSLFHKELFRLMHNMKGNAQAANFADLADFFHQIENLLFQWDKEITKVDINLLDLIFENADRSILEKKKNLDINYDFTFLLKKIETSINHKTKKANSLKILLVDDEEVIVETYQDILAMNYEATFDIAHNGDDAVKFCHNFKYDLILTDFRMPKLDGHKFIEIVRSDDNKNAKTPILFISGQNPMLAANYKTWENVLIIEKPVNIDKLLFMIKCSLKLSKAC